MIMSNTINLSTVWRRLAILLFVGVTLLTAAQQEVLAATLSITPDTGVYTTGEVFTARVLVNTQGSTINAADGVITFNPSEVTVVSVSQAGSIFGLWAEEPSVSGGRITFSGGAPRGYQGAGGTVVTITMRANTAGSKRLSWQSGSVLAADGQGTNVLSNMRGATYTVGAQAQTPTPEVIEYVPPANTPGAPAIRSSSHPEQDGWYQATRAVLSWNVPAGVTEVRTAFNQNPSAVPNQVAGSVIDSVTIDDVPEGVSYLHVQFRNADGWGTIGRYRVAVSTTQPSGVELSLPEGADLTKPEQSVTIRVASSTAPITKALVQIDGAQPLEFELSGASSTIELPPLEAGYHSLVVEVQDAAGNGQIVTLSFTIEAFERPVFIDVPTQINEGVVPVFRGQSRPRSVVQADIRNVANDTVRSYEVVADDEGVFTVVPESALATGVYELSATAIDEHGAISERSQRHRFAVQPPGYLQLGAMMVSVLSIIVPLVAMTVLLGLFGWYVVYRIRRLRSRVLRESGEAHAMLTAEFAALRAVLGEQEEKLTNARKTKKLTKAEQELLDEVRAHLTESEKRVEKEIADVEQLVPAHKDTDT